MLTRAGYLIVVLLIGMFVIVVFRLPQVAWIETAAWVILGPAQNSANAPVRGATDFFDSIGNIGTLQAENEQLRTEIQGLQSQVVRLQELERENASLKSQLQFKQSRPSMQWQPARIIGRDLDGLINAVVIDRGTNDGLAEGMTVMTTAGLVGHVVQVSVGTAKVLLIADVSSSVNGVLQDTRSRGVVFGTRTQTLVMRYIPQGDRVKEGEVVLTSGLGGIFPPDIPIGRVIQVRQRDIDMFQEATIEPSVNFDKIEEVLVITNHLPIKLD